jgi:ElaA protein
MTIKRLIPGDDLSDAYDVRYEVFITEQGFSPDNEKDDTDAVAHHIVFYRDGRPVATARTFPDMEEEGCYVIGRVCVLRERRGDGTGKRLMQEAEAYARELGARGFLLGAQVQASGFYAKLGYTPYGENYYDEFCEHVHMRKA